MALQGTLDTFELPDVLRLLASTKKSGRLRLQSDRGDGSVWLTDGQVVAVSSSAGSKADPGAGLFDLLRAREGSFAFGSDETSPDATSGIEVELLLADALERLAEWREIEKVVPSIHAWVALASDLPSAEMTIDASTWTMVTAVAGGVTVGELGTAMGLAEVDVCRIVRDLVELGLGCVTEGAATAKLTADRGAVAADRFEPVPVAHEELVAPVAPMAPVGDEPAAASWLTQEPADLVASEASNVHTLPHRSDIRDEVVDSGVGTNGSSNDLGDYGLDDDEADEVARQLAMLSPKAAQAVAAAAAAETEAERDAALAALDDTEPVNRSLLLKFLGSVKS